MPPKKSGTKILKRYTPGKQAKTASAPAVAALANPEVEDSIALHPDSEEEAALLAELNELRQVKAQEDQQQARAAQQQRCQLLRNQINSLKGQIKQIREQ
jgi:hypothetical protein